MGDDGQLSASARPRRRRRRSFALLAAGLALALAFAAGEVFVRLRYDIVDPRPYHWPGNIVAAPPPLRWELQKGYAGRYHQQLEALQVTTNSLGMRDPEPTEARREAPRRVLVLGDSIAYGRGVADPHPFARHIERWGDGIAAFNAGVEGYDTVQELARLERLGPVVRPHLVLLEWFRNDFTDPSDAVEAQIIEGQFFTDEESYRTWKARYVDHTANPLDWSALIRFARIQWKNWKIEGSIEERSQNPWTIERSDRKLVRSFEAIRGIRAWCQRSGARLAVVMFPAREEVEQDGPPPKYPGYLADLCRSEGIPFLDLTARWKAHWKATERTLYLPRDRCHPNVDGHEQVAAWIGEAFRALLPGLEQRP